MVIHVSTPESGNTGQTEHANGQSIWIRGLYMLLFIVVSRLTEAVIALVMLIQFILKAATGDTNSNLLTFGDQLSQYIFEIVRFQTFNTEDKPFPFRQWPQSGELNK